MTDALFPKDSAFNPENLLGLARKMKAIDKAVDKNCMQGEHNDNGMTAVSEFSNRTNKYTEDTVVTLFGPRPNSLVSD
ncbi:hypothetical protein CYMTET_18953 [Cymbomonas tetramitiformis]|uniref:Uncharacterized protein n=1 Tax=Cymbomonas tetramitiformis TaxID=36881 RepID=A0AAE0G7N6_9CHLO|nr:hypothetical protein CYMTET_18953 [Cymbomonas tetramitiformis]